MVNPIGCRKNDGGTSPRSPSGPGVPAGGSACQSNPSSGAWNEAISSRIGLPPWLAVTCRVENDRPSRVRATSNVSGSPGVPGRMK